MHIQVSGKQVDLSSALKHRVNAHLGTLAERYFDKGLEAQVTFSRARSFFTCDINVRAGRGLILRGEGEASDANAAFDDAAEHIAKRLRRYHRRVTTHSRTAPRQELPQKARSYILRPVDESEQATPAEESQSRPDETYATIIAEQPTDIPLLAVGEAVMRLDLAGSDFMLFRNAGNRQISLVYRRDDGNIGWVDTAPV
ncbi:ribosome hibernation-promoting factor, HPF/YfiA family [Acetobacter papayae]|uniref:ribosome hibernation-promoting factor, HPF/YfiA family n=1 Tax=Acetobacter papayae TaxID=1076592 RepID=UPI0039E765CC